MSNHSDLYEYLVDKLNDLSAAARMVIVLDPDRRLRLDEKAGIGRRPWRVIGYDGNDLAFRRQWPHQIDVNSSTLVWATGSAWPVASNQINLSSLTDVVRQADDILDLSLVGVLSALMPRETWPPESVNRHADILASRLNRVVEAYTDLRPHLGLRPVLDSHSIRALALSCLQPAIAPKPLSIWVRPLALWIFP